MSCFAVPIGRMAPRSFIETDKARARASFATSQSYSVVPLKRVGDAPGANAMAPVGTINLLCAVSVPLSEEAALEALSIAVEARTAAVLEARHPSRRSGAPATGTGTDCVVLAWPEPVAPPAVFAGKHTALGHVIGRAVGDCVRAGVADWLEAQACR